jgi:dolichol kinase
MSWQVIQIIAALAFVAIIISRRLHIFQSVHAVKRRTYGEILFPVAVGLCASLTDVRLIFTAAVLHLSVADGLASIIGTRYGQKTRYRILGQNKSWVGTATFYLASLVIVGVATIGNMDQFLHANVWLLAMLPLMATAAESFGVFGIDDVTVPLLVLGLLQWLHVMH